MKFNFLYIASVFVISIGMGIQGFDMCDEGWVLTGYQQFFNDPNSIQYLFLYYLSQFTGAIWNTLFGDYGILGFRILTAITVTLTAFIVYKILSPYFSRWAILLGTWLSICCSGFIMVFHHNYLTSLLVVCTIYFIHQSLSKRNSFFMYIAGIVLGMTTFARLPNVTMTALIIVLIPYYFYSKSWSLIKRMFLSAILGYVTGILLIMVTMIIFGHLTIFKEAIEFGFLAGKDSESTHNLSSMISTYMDNYKKVFISFLYVGLIPCVLLIIEYKNIYIKNCYLLYAGGVICAIAYVIVLRDVIPPQVNMVYILYALSTTILIINLFFHHNVTIACLSTLGLVNLYCLPLGSDFGIGNMGPWCIWFALPLSTGIICQHISKSSKKLKITYSALLFLFVITVSYKWYNTMLNGCYFDSGSRLEKRFKIHSDLANTYTTKENCDMLNPLLSELNKHVQPEDKLLCFQSCGMIHFLTRTKPYLKNPWVWTYTPSMVKKKMMEAENENVKLPVIVREKSTLPTWYKFYPDWNNDHAKETYIHKNKRITYINEFITRHHYTVIWENKVFQILLSTNNC